VKFYPSGILCLHCMAVGHKGKFTFNLPEVVPKPKINFLNMWNDVAEIKIICTEITLIRNYLAHEKLFSTRSEQRTYG
jgi:hypothetical protein